ncbi:MAG: hypothetical protein P1P60_00255 [Treponema phagedenis]|uniref:hypothetical protein n=1 Tax=Treponema phagedenis TaxID=162 RepID=UPI003133F6B5
MTNKEKYRNFYKSHPDICVFSAPWWLDAVAGEAWDVILIEEGGSIIASFPYVYTKGKLGIKKIEMPQLTQKLGPYIVYDKNISYTSRIGYEHKIYQKIINALPVYDEFNISFDQNYKNWLPFYWNGFEQTVRYSYRLIEIKDYEKIFDFFTKEKKKKIKKHSDSLFFKMDMPFDVFYDYFEAVIKQRGGMVSYSRSLFKTICEHVYINNAGKIFYCVDSKDNIHAIQFVIWDSKIAYALTGIRLKEYNTTGGTEFLIYEIIKYVSQFVDVFDFEGSMIKGVEESYRYFGTQQTEYYSISKVNNKLLKLYRALRS